MPTRPVNVNLIVKVVGAAIALIGTFWAAWGAYRAGHESGVSSAYLAARDRSQAPDRTVTCRVTSEAKDRNDRGVLDLDGVDISDYMLNPIVFANHQFGFEDVIGKVQKLWKEGDGWYANIFLLPRPSWYSGPTWLPDQVLYVFSNHIGGASVHLIDVDACEATADEKARYGQGIRSVIHRSVLLEISLTPLPAIPNAVQVNR